MTTHSTEKIRRRCWCSITLAATALGLTPMEVEQFIAGNLALTDAQLTTLANCFHIKVEEAV